MPFKSGHKYHPPKDPDAAIGRQKFPLRRHKILAVAGNERIEPAVFIEYWTRVAMGHANVRLAEDDDSVVFVTWDETGVTPTQAERDAAMRELVNRTHGQAPQMHHLQHTLRGTQSAVGDLGQLDPSVVFAILDARDAARALPPSPSELEATDAEIVESPAQPTNGDELSESREFTSATDPSR